MLLRKKFAITIEESEKMESLNYEVSQRFAILKYIKDNSIQLTKELKDQYNWDYFDFCIQRQIYMESLADKYAKTQDKQRFDFMVNTDHKFIVWKEFT